MQIYVVKENDTVDIIGGYFGISPYTLAWANQIEPPYRLAVGQALFIPDGVSEGARREITLGGYAYPWIEQDVLEETAAFLTGISVFSYGFTAEGTLIYPEEEGERRILETASLRQVVPVLVLTPLDEEGHFNNYLVSVLVRNLKVQQRMIRELWAVIQEKGYRAVNVDFEYVLAEDREGFAEFVRRLRVILNLYGIAVTVALAPKTSDDQPGLLYEGIDYGALGEAANGVFLMTYEWGYTYSEPMAVAPLPMVRRVAEYALSRISREKIILGIPNYGYDWPLPYVRGTTKAQSISYTDAIRLAVDHGVRIFFDEVSQTPWFRYWQYGIQHEVWFEDVRSYQAKFRLMEELGLPGAGFWQLMRLFRAGWLLADSMYKIRKLEGKY
ncbi:MAG: glycosyl hydrolase family 18 protein [Otoolea sp.]|nr:glycosyl hydrolase family 18 protein [Clostridiaceae bacterium]MDY5483083.1 glycosyl hydrolase family 18 protein [Clostridium sp.]